MRYRGICLLGKVKGSSKGTFPHILTMLTPQVIIPSWTIFPLWGGNHIALPEPSRRLCM